MQEINQIIESNNKMAFLLGNILGRLCVPDPDIKALQDYALEQINTIFYEDET